MYAVSKRGCLVNNFILSLFRPFQYTMDGMLSWMKGWKRNGWQSSNQTPVKNQDLWLKLDFWQNKYRTSGIRFNIDWVKGHDGLPGNEAADALAVAGAMKVFRAPKLLGETSYGR